MAKQYEISRKYLLLLLLYGVLIFLVCCLILFPKEKAAREALQFFSRRLGCTLTAQKLNIGFPGQMEIQNLIIKNRRAKNFPALQIDSLKIKPKLSQLFSKKITILFTIHLYQGDLKGTASLDLWHPSRLKEFECRGQGIQLAELKQITDLFNLHISGKLSGQAKVKLKENNLLTMNGNYSFKVTPGDVQIMNFPNFNFQRINGEGSLNQGMAKIRSVRIQGDELQAQISGDVRLNKNVVKSYLTSRVKLHFSQKLRDKLGPLANFLPKQNKKGIHLMIKGNLNNLSFMPI